MSILVIDICPNKLGALARICLSLIAMQLISRNHINKQFRYQVMLVFKTNYYKC